MTLFLVVLLAIANPSHGSEHVACIELNSFFDRAGKLVFEQNIFWEIEPATGRFQVRSWCMVDDREALNRRPVKNVVTGLYQVDWYDTDKQMQRKITSRIYRESYSQIDPEIADKRTHNERNRISLVHRLAKEPQE